MSVSPLWLMSPVPPVLSSQWVPPGRTPIVTLDLRVAGILRRIWLKLESYNPHGSSKTARRRPLWESIRNRVHPAEGVIESTSGNLGIALAARCAGNGIPFTAVVEPRTNPAAVDTMRRYGARVVMIDRPDPAGGYLLMRLTYVREQVWLRPSRSSRSVGQRSTCPRSSRTAFTTMPPNARSSPRGLSVLEQRQRCLLQVPSRCLTTSCAARGQPMGLR
jgi:N-(2-amino-2-carboxyethyl)-L-glutamate synthase